MISTGPQINKSRLGGLRRIELYGNPGTPEGRSKVGVTRVSFSDCILFSLNIGVLIP